MIDNPNESSASNESHLPRLAHRWRATIIVAAIGLAIPSIIAISEGRGPRSPVEDNWDLVIAYVFIVGAYVAFFFGHLLAHPNDPIHTWNAFLYFAGGILSWTLIGAYIGLSIDLLRSRTTMRIRKAHLHGGWRGQSEAWPRTMSPADHAESPGPSATLLTLPPGRDGF